MLFIPSSSNMSPRFGIQDASVCPSAGLNLLVSGTTLSHITTIVF
jgi:hypothetical protein